MKVERKIFKGIEYVEATELPGAQRERLFETINRNLFIKILIEGKVVSQCLQYKDYLNWFETIYSVKQPVIAKEMAASQLKISGELALDKI